MGENQFRQLKKGKLSKGVKTFIIIAVVLVVLSVGSFFAYSTIANKNNAPADVVVKQEYSITYNLIAKIVISCDIRNILTGKIVTSPSKCCKV